MAGSGWALAGQRVESGVQGTDGASGRPHRLDQRFFPLADFDLFCFGFVMIFGSSFPGS